MTYRRDRVFRFVGWFVKRGVYVPERLVDWSLKREVERKGYRW